MPGNFRFSDELRSGEKRAAGVLWGHLVFSPNPVLSSPFLRRLCKRTDVDRYPLPTRGGKGVINVKTTAEVGQAVAINLVASLVEAGILEGGAGNGKMVNMESFGISSRSKRAVICREQRMDEPTRKRKYPAHRFHDAGSHHPA
jgi:hypothetical protein